MVCSDCAKRVVVDSPGTAGGEAEAAVGRGTARLVVVGSSEMPRAAPVVAVEVGGAAVETVEVLPTDVGTAESPSDAEVQAVNISTIAGWASLLIHLDIRRTPLFDLSGIGDSPSNPVAGGVVDISNSAPSGGGDHVGFDQTVSIDAGVFEVSPKAGADVSQP